MAERKPMTLVSALILVLIMAFLAVAVVGASNAQVVKNDLAVVSGTGFGRALRSKPAHVDASPAPSARAMVDHAHVRTDLTLGVTAVKKISEQRERPLCCKGGPLA